MQQDSRENYSQAEQLSANSGQQKNDYQPGCNKNQFYPGIKVGYQNFTSSKNCT